MARTADGGSARPLHPDSIRPLLGATLIAAPGFCGLA